MTNPPRTLGFVLAATEHGTMILNRFDHNRNEHGTYGVGHKLLEDASYEQAEIANALRLLAARLAHFGDGVVAIEAQARIFYAWPEILRSTTVSTRGRSWLRWRRPMAPCACPRRITSRPAASVAWSCGPRPVTNSSVRRSTTARTGSPKSAPSPSTLWHWLDLIKIDVEGMEIEVLAGADATIARWHPVIVVERLKTDVEQLVSVLTAHGYRLLYRKLNVLAIHPNDPSWAQVPMRVGDAGGAGEARG